MNSGKGVVLQPNEWLNPFMAESTRRRATVVGSAQTELRGTSTDRQYVDLIMKAVTQALLGAGLRMSTSSSTPEATFWTAPASRIADSSAPSEPTRRREKRPRDGEVIYVADALRMFKGSVYYYIDSKESLLEKIFEGSHDGLMKPTRKAIDGEEPAIEHLTRSLEDSAGPLTTKRFGRSPILSVSACTPVSSGTHPIPYGPPSPGSSGITTATCANSSLKGRRSVPSLSRSILVRPRFSSGQPSPAIPDLYPSGNKIDSLR